MNADYFIKKFEATKEEDWCIEEYETGVRRCALGHCGVHWRSDEPMHETEEGSVLRRLFSRHGLNVALTNDSLDEHYPQVSPKQRVLAALRDIQAKEESAR